MRVTPRTASGQECAVGYKRILQQCNAGGKEHLLLAVSVAGADAVLDADDIVVFG